jgi:hypothetical protein
MLDTSNPYESPETSVTPVKPLAAQGTLTETMLMYLKQTSPWLRFIGILGFIQCGFMVLGAFLFLTLVPMGNLLNEIGRIEGIDFFLPDLGTIFGGAFGVYFLGGAVLLFVPSYFVYNFGSKIRTYLLTGADKDLEGALKNNKSLWKFCGILAIISLALIPVVVMISIIVVVAVSL